MGKKLAPILDAHQCSYKLAPPVGKDWQQTLEIARARPVAQVPALPVLEVMAASARKVNRDTEGEEAENKRRRLAKKRF